MPHLHFLWFSYGFPLVFLWFSYGFSYAVTDHEHSEEAWKWPLGIGSLVSTAQ